MVVVQRQSLYKHMIHLETLLPLQVLQSAAGYYVGTCDEDGPVSRESNEYFKNRETAEQALADGNWSQKAEP